MTAAATTSGVVLLFGGSSGERRVSVASAQNISAAMPEAQPWFVAPDGRVFEVTSEALARHERAFESDFVPAGASRFASLSRAFDDTSARGRVFVLGFHGGGGEDGTVQRELELRGLPFTASGSAASARAFDKTIAKRTVREHGVRVADAITLPAGDLPAIRGGLGDFFARHGRVVCKPIADGSSVGLHHVRNADELAHAVEAIAAARVAYLAEVFVAGRELTIGVVDDGVGGGPRALCASEVRMDPGRAFDFDGKYLGKGTVEITPADVNEAVSTAARDMALTAHRALGCEGYSRTDVIVSEAGPVFLETNTLPGLTRASFLPQQLAVAGITMRAFLEAQLELALKRRSGRGR